MKKVELLLPAKNFKSIKAIEEYANAVYFGSESLNMRMNADNIAMDEFPEVISYCHDHKLKAYLATNVIVYENELEYLKNLLQKAKEAQIDAVIVHDLAAIQICRDLKLPFHISTQTSISNSHAARFYESLGANRIILARELSLEMIGEITQKMTQTQIEIFVHGAQCTSISGRCYFSPCVSDNHELSANRGRCTQPCRRKWTVTHEDGVQLDYDGVYFLNTKDLCLIEYIPKILQYPIAALKVEGRMRDLRYIEVVAKCYREAIDSYYEGTYTPEKVSEWIKRLSDVYNRGFSTGFYFHQPTQKDISLKNAGNLSTIKKVQIGRVSAYYRDAQAAKIEIFNGQLQLGDVIYIEGGEMGTYVKQTITSMQLKKKEITQTPIASTNNNFIVGIKMDKPVKRGDWVYLYYG